MWLLRTKFKLDNSVSVDPLVPELIKIQVISM
jgi:hypothetical protein